MRPSPMAARRINPFAAVEITNSHGKVIYRHDQDEPPPKQIFDPKVIIDMVSMMKQVVLEGTARRAAIDGVDIAGKTGTTNGFKDAWFNGYSGNYVGTIWFGNDDDTPTNNMTGGSLPAATWHEIMAYAHQGIELKPLPGDAPTVAAGPVAQTTDASQQGAPQHSGHAVGRLDRRARRHRRCREGGRAEANGNRHASQFQGAAMMAPIIAMVALP